jgi:hypothetical protein
MGIEGAATVAADGHERQRLVVDALAPELLQEFVDGLRVGDERALRVGTPEVAALELLALFP